MVPKVLFLVLLGAALVLANPVSKDKEDSAIESKEPIEPDTEEKVSKWMQFVKDVNKKLKYIWNKYEVMKEHGGKLYNKLGEFFNQSKKCFDKLKDILSQSGKEGKELYDVLTKSEKKDAKEKETPKH